MAGLALVLSAAGAAAQPGPPVLPDGPGRALVAAKCGTCHALPIVTAQRKTLIEWETSIDAMVNRGMPASDDEFDLIAAYLARHFGRESR